MAPADYNPQPWYWCSQWRRSNKGTAEWRWSLQSLLYRKNESFHWTIRLPFLRLSLRLCDTITFSWQGRVRRGSTAARFLGLRVRVPSGTWMCVTCDCCELRGICLCNGPIPHQEERSVPECERGNSYECPRPPMGLSSHVGWWKVVININLFVIVHDSTCYRRTEFVQ